MPGLSTASSIHDRHEIRGDSLDVDSGMRTLMIMAALLAVQSTQALTVTSVVTKSVQTTFATVSKEIRQVLARI